MRWLTHKLAPLAFFAVLAFPAAVVHFLQTPWVAGVVIAGSALFFIIWGLRVEYAMSRAVEADPFAELP